MAKPNYEQSEEQATCNDQGDSPAAVP